MTARVRARPAWHAEPLDPDRILRESDPADANVNVRDAGWVSSGFGLRIRFAEGATFWISSVFDEVWLEYDAPLTVVDAAHFLLEPVLAFLLRCRRTLVLHASAVEMDGRAVAFVGPVGAGKSTIAAACVAAGAALLSDDVLAIRLEGGDSSGQWHAHRGIGAIRLWDDGVRTLLGDPDLVPPFSETWSKRVLDPVLLGGPAAPAEAPLALICVLGASQAAGSPLVDAPRFEPLRGSAAFRALVTNTVASFLHDDKRRSEELQQLAQVLEVVPVVRFTAPRGLGKLGSMPAAISTAIAAAAAAEREPRGA
ncbi:MAG: hypothetical protein O2973_06105 [Gemmatimonadetes bacterium]|nr:hypothetical protein [Gemmatimonadota bacterium]